MSAPLRVAGTDPGTSSLDLLILEYGRVVDQTRFSPQQLQADPTSPVRWLSERGPLALVAGPSGYGVPCIRACDLTEAHVEQMTLIRSEERGTSQGVLGFRATLQAFRTAPFPVVFLPGVIHLPTVPAHRKFNRIDLGTPDKLCVAALALLHSVTCCVVELGTVFTACLVVRDGQIVDGVGGSAGPVGWHAPGAWDGEVAYLRSPLSKRDLFHGGAGEVPREQGIAWFVEALVKTVAGLRAITPFEQVVVSGRLAETEPEVFQGARTALNATELPGLPGAWVKHAAQGAAILADGLASGGHADLVAQLRLREAHLCGDRFPTWAPRDSASAY